MSVVFTGDRPLAFYLKTRRQLLEILNDEATQLETNLVRVTPADNGQLRQGWTLRTATESNLTAIVGQSKQYFLPLELGRRPGTGISQTGQESVARWASRKGIDDPESFAFLLSRKYKQEGRPASGFAGLARPGQPAPTQLPDSLEPVGGPLAASFSQLRRRLSS